MILGVVFHILCESSPRGSKSPVSVVTHASKRLCVLGSTAIATGKNSEPACYTQTQNTCAPPTKETHSVVVAGALRIAEAFVVV